MSSSGGPTPQDSLCVPTATVYKWPHLLYCEKISLSPLLGPSVPFSPCLTLFNDFGCRLPPSAGAFALRTWPQALCSRRTCSTSGPSLPPGVAPGLCAVGQHPFAMTTLALTRASREVKGTQRKRQLAPSSEGTSCSCWSRELSPGSTFPLCVQVAPHFPPRSALPLNHTCAAHTAVPSPGRWSGPVCSVLSAASQEREGPQPCCKRT